MTDVQALAARLTKGCTTPAARAVALHNYVRDIPFGFTAWFDSAPPKRTLQCGRGHCNPKAALFVALLRAVGFEARIHAVNISAGILAGCFPEGAGPSQVTHTYTEVKAPPHDAWIRLDSYTVDRPLHKAAVARLRREGRAMGYGVHVDGTVEWDGASDAFVQFVDPPSMMLEDLGTFDCIEQVIKHPRYLHRTPLGLTFSALLRPAALLLPDRWLQHAFNSRVDAVRGAASSSGTSSKAQGAEE